VKKKQLLKGMVIRGSRNVFTVRFENKEIECRIKGKVLKASEGFYNPLAPGDLVEASFEDGTSYGLITGLEERKNGYARFNQKGQAPQLLAANVDLVLCVTSPASPPFRPRFLDRALLQADNAGIPAVIVCNKYDLVDDEAEASSLMDGDWLDTEERLSDFDRIGFQVFYVSALNGDGIDDLKDFIAGKTSVLVGQSGVGKSSLIKALIPGLEIKTGAINEKFDRGNHVTTQAVMLDLPQENQTRIIDTPGIRRFAPAGIKADDLILHMREFAPLAGKCSYGLSCSHETEIGCKIMEAVHAGVIHEDRYESFLRIREEMINNHE